MSRVAALTGNPTEPDPFDPVRQAESVHQGLKLGLRVSPLAAFVLEAGIMHRISVTRTRAAIELLEAAAMDGLEAHGHDLESEEFRVKYLEWLIKKPTNLHLGDDFNKMTSCRLVTL